MTLRQFEQLVADALDSVPERFARLLDNVEVVVEIWPSASDLSHVGGPMTLFGLYHGVPQTNRGTYQAVLPDKISIYAGPIVRAYGEDPRRVKRAVRDTVLHEIGHHFGLSDEEISAAMGT